ncbi:MAG: glycosyltransferase family 4 protein [Alphaproteobacteria bacterium]|nr:glycosyltransferase family 4 protein [Alphaproteobacteria bacterium]
MKILMISDVYFPRVNGVSTSIKTYRDDLRQLGHECTLVVPAYKFPPEVADDDDIIRIESWQVPFDPEDRLLRWTRLKAWARQLDGQRFDAIHIQTPFTAHYMGVKLARHFNIPSVETYHTYFEHYLHHYVPLLPSFLTKGLARRLSLSQCQDVDHVISPSPQMAQTLRAYGVTKPISILPTGMPSAAFEQGDRAKFRARMNIEPDRPVALYVGRVAHEKNIDFLIRMMQQLKQIVPNALLVVAGEGPAQNHIERLVKTMGLHNEVRFVGYLDRAHGLLDCYRSADVFVFASRTETQGLVILEALAQGTPVVSTAVMGTADVMADVKGGIIVPEQELVFAEAVATVLQNKCHRDGLSLHAVQDALRWSSQDLAKRLVGLYERL